MCRLLASNYSSLSMACAVAVDQSEAGVPGVVLSVGCCEELRRAVDLLKRSWRLRCASRLVFGGVWVLERLGSVECCGEVFGRVPGEVESVWVVEVKVEGGAS